MPLPDRFRRLALVMWERTKVGSSLSIPGRLGARRKGSLALRYASQGYLVYASSLQPESTCATDSWPRLFKGWIALSNG